MSIIHKNGEIEQVPQQVEQPETESVLQMLQAAVVSLRSLGFCNCLRPEEKTSILQTLDKQISQFEAMGKPDQVDGLGGTLAALTNAVISSLKATRETVAQKPECDPAPVVDTVNGEMLDDDKDNRTE